MKKIFILLTLLVAGCGLIAAPLYQKPLSASSRRVQLSQEQQKRINAALINSVKDDRLRETRAMLRDGANANTRDQDGVTVLMHAVENENEAIVKLLHDYGASLDACHREGGGTALHDAAESENLLMVQYLLHLGANRNISDHTGSKPLHIASETGNQKIMEALLLTDDAQRTQQLRQQRSDGWTPLHCAVDCGYINSVILLG